MHAATLGIKGQPGAQPALSRTLQLDPSSAHLCLTRPTTAAGFNQLTRLPEELAHCRLLRVLDLRNNKIAVFPDACCTLELNLLDLTNNSIR
jgi:hypothetical protein